MTATSQGKQASRHGLFARLILFVRQIISELKKVVRPTRQELITYATVVLVFVAIMMTFIGIFDLGIGFGVQRVFG